MKENDFVFGVLQNFGGGGDHERKKVAVCHFCNLVRADERFQRMFLDVVQEAGFDNLIDGVLAEAQAGKLGKAADRYRQALFDPEIRDVVVGNVRMFVHETLKVSWPWVVPALALAVNQGVQNAVAESTGGERLRVLIADSVNVTGDERKRFQSPDHETVRTHVDWFYRSKVKQPPETISAIARKSGRTNKSIRDGIKTAQELLR